MPDGFTLILHCQPHALDSALGHQRGDWPRRDAAAARLHADCFHSPSSSSFSRPETLGQRRRGW